MSNVSEFLIAMEGCMREYDASAFVSNSASAIAGTIGPQLIDVRNDIYERSLREGIQQLEDVFMDTRACATFIQNIKNTPRFDNISMLPGLCSTDITFRLNYLKDYSMNLSVATGKLLEALDNPDKFSMGLAACNRLTADGLNSAIKKQVVRTSLNIYDVNPKDMIAVQCASPVQYNRDYLESRVLPFVSAFNDTKRQTMEDAKNLIRLINEMMDTANARNRAVLDLCRDHQQWCRDVNRANYQLNRGFVDILSFVTYALLLKMSAIVKNARTCNLVMDQLMKASAPMSNLISEGCFNSNLCSDATGTVAAELITGRIDAFAELASNLMEFHKGLLMPRFSTMEDPNAAMDSFLHDIAYPTEPYNSILEILSIIMSSLDTLYAASDDYLLVFDELIGKAGLDNPIDVRYKERIDLVSNTSEYDSATEIAVNGEGNMSIYGKILGEINDFPKNVQMIADHIHDVRQKIDDISSRFTNNINREYQNSNAIEELKAFMVAFDEQFNNMITSMAGNLMTRLKKLGLNAERISVKIDQESPMAIGFEESAYEDYELEVDKILLEYEQELTDCLMSVLMEEHQELWLKKTRHLELVQEVGEPTISTKPKSDGAPIASTSQTNATGTNSAQAAQGEAAKKQNITNKLNSLKANLQKRFQEMLNKFRTNMANRTVAESVMLESENGVEYVTEAVRYPEWIAQKKDSLLNRSYANVSLQILPYSTKMPFSQIISEASQFKNTVTAISPGDVSTLKTNADIFNKLYSAQGVITFNAGTAMDECKSKATEALTKYYKVGKAPLEMVTYSNNNLKNLMTDIVQFCESYYATEQEHLLGIINGISDSINGMTNKFVTESADMIYGKVAMLYEADGDPSKASTTPTVTTTPDAQPATGNTQTATATNAMTPANMIETVQEGAAIYSGAILNAVRDRVADYFNAMRKMVPKTAATPAAPAQPATQPQVTTTPTA